jgi:hypothetical protein
MPTSALLQMNDGRFETTMPVVIYGFKPFNTSLSQNGTFYNHHISMRYGPLVTSKDDLNS